MGICSLLEFFSMKFLRGVCLGFPCVYWIEKVFWFFGKNGFPGNKKDWH